MPPKPPDLFLSIDVPPDIHAAIGAVATEWALLEHYVDRTVWVLSGTNSDACACITSQLSNVGRRLDALISLLHLLKIDSHIIADLRSFAEKANGLSRQRNRIVHDTWSVGLTTKRSYRLEITADKKGPVFEFKDIPKEEILKTVRDIQKCRHAYNSIERRIFDSLPSSSETPLESSPPPDNPTTPLPAD